MTNCIPVRVVTAAGEESWSCPTCKDEGIPARILSLEAGNTAMVWMNGGPSEVALDLLDGPKVGDFILVHLGTAIATLRPEDVTEDEQTP